MDVILVLNASFRNKHSQEAKGRLNDQREPGVGTVEVMRATQLLRASKDKSQVYYWTREGVSL